MKQTQQIIGGSYPANTCNFPVGETSGAVQHKHTTSSHKLTINEIPSHYHSGLYWNGNRISLNQLSQSGYGLPWSSSSNADEQCFSVGNTGGGAAHSHGDTNAPTYLPPYLVVYMWRRTA